MLHNCGVVPRNRRSKKELNTMNNTKLMTNLLVNFNQFPLLVERVKCGRQKEGNTR